MVVSVENSARVNKKDTVMDIIRKALAEKFFRKEVVRRDKQRKDLKDIEESMGYKK